MSNYDSGQEVKRLELYRQLLGGMLTYLSMKPRTVYELQSKLDKLLEKLPQDVTDEDRSRLSMSVREYLVTERLWDDQRYLDDYKDLLISSTKKRSPSQIRAYLMRKGVDAVQVSKLLENIRESAKGFGEALEKDLAKKARSYSRYDLRTRKMKLKNYLYSKGYTPEAIEEAIDTFYKLK